MALHAIDHPLVAARLAVCRDASTPTEAFRSATREIAALLTYEAARDWPTERGTVTGPLETAPVSRLAGPAPLVVPILRAGLGMLGGVLDLLPAAEVALLGARRDEKTLDVTVYVDGLPHRLEDRRVLVCDPMLATGSSLGQALRRLADAGATHVSALCLLAAPEGLARIADDFPFVDLFVAAVDRCLDSRAFIRPGLGDAGDRFFGPSR